MKKALIISCFNWYKDRLEPIRELLLKQNYEVTVIESDFNHFKKAPVENRYPECTYVHVPPYKKNISIRRVKSHLSFGQSVGQVLEQYAPDLIYCLIPPNNVAKVCGKYKSKHQDVKLVFDIIDLWPESMPVRFLKAAPFIRTWKRWRDDALILADHVFTECRLFQEELRYILNPGKTSTLYLYKEQTDKERLLIEEIIKQKQQDDIIRFAYLGSMNNIIDINGICSVISQFVEAGNKCELHAIGDGESREGFEAAVSKTGCRTIFYGPVFEELDKIKILAPCDYALNIMKENISVGLTTKSIDYLSYGLPLINNIKVDTWSLVKDEGIGINCNSNELQAAYTSFPHETVLRSFDEHFSKDTFIRSLKKAI